MNTREIAEKLCAHCRNGTEAQALEELYADNAESVEPMAMEGMDRVAHGKEAIQGKHDWWSEAMEVSSETVEGPFIHDNQFAVIFSMDVTEKASGKSWSGREIGLYEVEDGKIVRESFFAKPMG